MAFLYPFSFLLIHALAPFAFASVTLSLPKSQLTSFEPPIWQLALHRHLSSVCRLRQISLVLNLGLVLEPQPAALVFVLLAATTATIVIRAPAVPAKESLRDDEPSLIWVPVTPTTVLIVAMATKELVAVVAIAGTAVADFNSENLYYRHFGCFTECVRRRMVASVSD